MQFRTPLTAMIDAVQKALGELYTYEVVLHLVENEEWDEVDAYDFVRRISTGELTLPDEYTSGAMCA